MAARDILLLYLAVAFGLDVAFASIAVHGRRVEYLINPLGVDIPHPRFSWEISSTVGPSLASRGEHPVACQVLVYTAVGLVWDSGKIPYDGVGGVSYNGSALTSDTSYYWNVTTWLNTGQTAASSASSWFRTGLASADWKSAWITGNSSGMLFRKDFKLSGFSSASLFVAGLGYNEVYINGQKLGDHKLDAAWTDYAAKVYYSSFDAAPLLRADAPNTIGVTLGNGWFFPPYLPTKAPPQLLLQLHVDGAPIVLSDTSWRTARGPIIEDSLYNGEHFDGRRAQDLTGWASPGFVEGAISWANASLASSEANKARLASQLFEPIKHISVLPALTVRSPTPGVQVFDFGQNLAGVTRLKLQAGQCACGQNITVRHAEVLLHPPYGPADGTLYTKNLRGAQQTDVYTCAGAGQDEEYTPTFTQHGFRYASVQVDGSTFSLSQEQLVAVEMHSAVQPRGSLTFGPTTTPHGNSANVRSSNSTEGGDGTLDVLNGIHHAVVWSQKGNLMGLPTGNNSVQ
jgi:alpha-L-rhamnosidase